MKNRNCPCCGKEMREGYIKSSHAVFWAPDRNAISPEGVLLTGSLWKGFWKGHSVPSWLCESCDLVITRIEK